MKERKARKKNRIFLSPEETKTPENRYLIRQAKFERPLLFATEEREVSGILRQVQRFHLLVEPVEGGELLRIPKETIRYIHAVEVRDAVVTGSRRSRKIGGNARGAPAAPQHRRRFPEKALERAWQEGRLVTVRLLSGEVFEGDLKWISPFSLRLLLAPSVGVLIFKHAVERLATKGKGTRQSRGRGEGKEEGGERRKKAEQRRVTESVRKSGDAGPLPSLPPELDASIPPLEPVVLPPLPRRNSPTRSELARILRKEKLRDFKRPIWEMPREELLEHFAAKSSGRPLASAIIKNIIWQVHRWVEGGQLTPPRGNIRSFWETFVEPTLIRAGIVDTPTDHYQTTISLFSRFIREYKLFFYRDFGFEDEGWESRRVGKTNPHIVLFTEKPRFSSLLKDVHVNYDVTIVSLRGMISALFSEYTAAEILAEITHPREFFLYSIVDYDPAGHLITRNFAEMLEEGGLTPLFVHDLVSPDLFTPEELERLKYPLKPNRNSRRLYERWYAAGKGVAGKRFGIAADIRYRHRIVDAFRRELAGLASRGRFRLPARERSAPFKDGKSAGRASPPSPDRSV